MGEAKRRKAEIEQLKRLSPEAAARRLDEQRVARGIDPENLAAIGALARLLRQEFEEARTTGTIDAPVKLFQTTINTMIQGLSDVPVACKKGCSHCCHTWVSATAPEILFIAKIITTRGDQVIQKIALAHEHTKDYDFDTRAEHPIPCPLLEQDLCSIYDARPKTCRLAASADAEICARAYHNITNEDVPTPLMHLYGRAALAVALSSALRKVGLPHHAYEFNAGLHRALTTPDAERRWLANDDIFRDVRLDPDDVFAQPQAEQLYEQAFANEQSL